MLKAIVASLDDVPEGVRDYYEAGTAEHETEGKFVLKVEPVDGFALENINGLKTTLGKEMSLRKSLEKQVVKYKDIDPDAAREALAKLQEMGDLDPAKDADRIADSKFQAAKAQLLEKHGQELAQRDERINTLDSALDGLVRREAAVKAIAEAKGSVDLLLPHVMAHTRRKETDDGKFDVEVIDASGNVRIGNAKGDPMDLKGLVAEMRQSETFARAFDADGHSGTGKQPDNPGGAKTKGDMGGSRDERKAAIAQRFKLPAE